MTAIPIHQTSSPAIEGRRDCGGRVFIPNTGPLAAQEADIRP